MKRKLIIFGNGLGMAIDPYHFLLENALNDVWDADVLPPQHKRLISQCLPHKDQRCPQGEEELDDLHLAISSCTQLGAINSDINTHWLSQYGWEFPSVCRNYISRVATHLYDFQGGLPSSFSQPLIDFLKQTNSHVATLNYDKLLYECFIENDVVSGYEGHLVDGVLNRGFDVDNLIRKYGKNFGYYLHLHGSPLFRDDRGRVIKLTRNEITPERPDPSSHIVLTHIKHKLAIIASSQILSAYWSQFAQALTETNEIIMFGYSGLDNHLNQLLSTYNRSLRIKVVEWRGSGELEKRSYFWQKQLKCSVELHQYDNILQFKEWEK